MPLINENFGGFEESNMENENYSKQLNFDNQ